jgi:hypothetical protein
MQTCVGWMVCAAIIACTSRGTRDIVGMITAMRAGGVSERQSVLMIPPPFDAAYAVLDD